MGKRRVDVGILTVIPAELWAAINTLCLDGREKSRNGTVYLLATVRSAFGGAYRVGLACIGDAGNPGAAAAATELIKDLNPRCVVLMGIAAGLRGKVKIGQVVISERIVGYERAAAEIGADGSPIVRPRADTERPPHALWQDVLYYRPDEDGIRTLFERAGGTIPEPAVGREAEFMDHVMRSISSSLATIASGDKLLKDPNALLRLRDIHGKVEVAEMEAAGFAEACRRQGTPWLVFRGISDFGDQFKDDRFHGFAARAAAAVMADFIANGLDLPGTDKAQPDPGQLERRPSSSNPSRLAGPVGAPNLPPHFLPRPTELDELKRQLLGGNSKPVGVTGAGRVGIQGMGGIGKTVLASALVHDGDVQRAFPDGIYWITVGQQPNIVDLQNELLYKIAKAPAVHAGQVKDAVREAFAGRRSLVVLDDVWNVEHAHAFCESCAPARLLVTTRNKPILVGIGAVEHRVDMLSPEDAVTLLASWALEDGTEPLPPQAGEIAKKCGYLPLAVAAIGAMIRLSPTAWADALTRLQRADLATIARAFPGYPYPDLLRALAVSVDALEETDRERYLDLAVFPEDQPIPEGVLTHLWGLDALATRDCMRRLAARSLASDAVMQGDEALLLHDLQRDMIRKRREAALPELHLRLLRAWDALPALPDAYAWHWLSYHLLEAGRTDDLRRLLFDFDCLQAKLHAADPNALIADYEPFTADDGLRSIQSALRLSAHVVGGDSAQLAGQLTGRLLGNTNAEVRALLNQAAQRQTVPWLRPLTRDLTAPGGGLVRTLEGHSGGVNSVAVAPDGRHAVSASADGTLRVWDLECGQSLRTLEGHSGGVNSVAVAPDGRHAVSASADGTLRVWGLESGRSLRTLEDYSGGVRAVAVTPDGRHAVSASADGTLRVWDLESGQSLCTLEGHSGGVRTVAITPDGRHAVSGSDDGMLRVWDLESGQSLCTLEGHSGGVRAVAVTPDGRHAVSSSADGTLRVWDLQSGQSLRTLEGHSGGVRAVAVTPDGRHAVSASADGTLRVWDLESGQSLRTLEGHSGGVLAVAVTPDGRHAVSASADGTLRVWDLESGQSLCTLEGHSGGVRAVAITPDGRHAVSTSDDSMLRVWDLQNGQSLRTLEGHSGGVRAVAVTPDGQHAVSASADGTLRVWDLENGQSLRTLEGHWGWVLAVAVTPDGRHAVSASDDGTLRVWDLQSGQTLRRLEGHWGWVLAVAVTPDGRHAVSASDDGMLRVWDLQNGQSLCTLEGHSGGVRAVAVTPDGRHAVSASDDRTMRVWDLQSADTLCKFTGDSLFTSCTITPDQQTIVAGDSAGNVHFLRLVEANQRESAIERVKLQLLSPA